MNRASCFSVWSTSLARTERVLKTRFYIQHERHRKLIVHEFMSACLRRIETLIERNHPSLCGEIYTEYVTMCDVLSRIIELMTKIFRKYIITFGIFIISGYKK